MSRDRRLLVLLIVLMACGLLVVQARHRQYDDTVSDVRHRHRHGHETSNGRRSRQELANRRSSWSSEVDYEDDSLAERDQEDEEDEEDDYDSRSYYERSYGRSRFHGRMYDPRYFSKYHRTGYRGSSWYDEDDKRYGASRHASRSYRLRNHRRPGYSRNRDADYAESDEDDYEYPKRRAYEDGDRLPPWWNNSKKHRGSFRRDYRPDGRRRHYANELEGSRKLDDWRGRSNSTELRFSRKRNEDFDDYEYHVDEDSDNDEEQGDSSKETDGEEDLSDDDEEIDNDFYKSGKKAPLKTFDDIIRRLTSDDSTTQRPTIKRDYRNIVIDKHMKRDAFGNFKYEPKNISRALMQSKVASAPYIGVTKQYPGRTTKGVMPGKLANSVIERKLAKNASSVAKGVIRQEKKIEDQPKTKSLEQDYDEYGNTPDNEKEEDLVKAGIEEDSGMQADVTNTDYTDDDNADENETPATITTSTTIATTTTTSSTTSRPLVSQNYDYRDTRAYESGTGPQYNGYQPKNDYPPMSAHSVHKWQSLGTRESVKETRSNMQQYNKNGKTAEIREALQHAIKVSREGSCQWPRPRVIPVRDVYPSPSTTYIPHCAILHRCSDDTGCCRSEALTCVPKHSHRVELSFYTTNVGGGSVVEKLSFYNHTECECKERSEYQTANEKPSSDQRVYSRHYQSSPQPQNMRRAQPRKPCRCPSEFTPRITLEGECQCNCYESHQNCIKIRRGKGYFSLADRLCIQNEECATPNCEFGEYMRRQGKCPRKKDKFDAIANYRTNFSHRYRS